MWAARFEMARTVEDVLARRTRALFLNARAALAMAPRVAELLARELGRDSKWQAEQVRAFGELRQRYTDEFLNRKRSGAGLGPNAVPDPEDCRRITASPASA